MSMQQHAPPLLTTMFLAGAAACTAELFTLPFSTLKVRLHLQGSHNFDTLRFSSPRDLVAKVIRNEGPAALWDGLLPGLKSHCIYAPLSVGLFEHVRNRLHALFPQNGDSSPTFSMRLASGFICTSIAIAISNPMDVLKIRMQTRNSNGSSAYNGLSFLDVARAIIRKEGFLGLWRGSSPNILRNLIMGTTQLSTFDHVRHFLRFRLPPP